MVELDDGACGHLPHTALPSKLTSPLASAFHFQTYFSSRWSTSLPNLLLLSLQHVTSKLTGCSSRCSTSLPNLLLRSSCFSTAHPNLLLSRSLQHFTAAKLTANKCSLFFSFLFSSPRPPPMHSTSLNIYFSSHFGAQPHTHTPIACTLSCNDRTRPSSRMFVSGESQSKCTHRLPVYLLNLSLTQAALHFRTYFSSHFNTQPHTHMPHSHTHT